MSGTTMRPTPGREELGEGVAELKQRLRSDLSRFAESRRYISLKPIVACRNCEGTGKVMCETCGGRGKLRAVYGEQPMDCTVCEATGRVTCTECAGAGEMANPHRKKLLVLIYAGLACWLLVGILLWTSSHDVMPTAFKSVNSHISKPVQAPPPPSVPQQPAAGEQQGAPAGGYNGAAGQPGAYNGAPPQPGGYNTAPAQPGGYPTGR